MEVSNSSTQKILPSPHSEKTKDESVIDDKTISAQESSSYFIYLPRELVILIAQFVSPLKWKQEFLNWRLLCKNLAQKLQPSEFHIIYYTYHETDSFLKAVRNVHVPISSFTANYADNILLRKVFGNLEYYGICILTFVYLESNLQYPKLFLRGNTNLTNEGLIGLEKVTALKILDITSCRFLTCNGNVELPHGLQVLNMKYTSLFVKSQNLKWKFPESLTELNLHDCGLLDEPFLMIVKQCPNLTKLDLSMNSNLKDEGFDQGLALCSKLQYLQIISSRLSFKNTNWPPSITHLDISYNIQNLCEESIFRLAAQLSRLVSINFEYCTVSNGALLSFAKCSHLTFMDLSYNKVNMETLTKLKDSLPNLSFHLFKINFWW